MTIQSIFILKCLHIEKKLPSSFNKSLIKYIYKYINYILLYIQMYLYIHLYTHSDPTLINFNLRVETQRLGNNVSRGCGRNFMYFGIINNKISLKYINRGLQTLQSILCVIPEPIPTIFPQNIGYEYLPRCLILQAKNLFDP